MCYGYSVRGGEGFRLPIMQHEVEDHTVDGWVDRQTGRQIDASDACIKMCMLHTQPCE